MKQTIKKLGLFLDTEEEITEMIKGIIGMGFEEFDSLFEQNRSFIGKKLMQRGTIRNRYPELSREYDEVIGKGVSIKRIRNIESNIVNQINENKELAKTNTKYDSGDINYSISKYIHLKNDAMINISICYNEMIAGKGYQRKYGYGISVIKSEAPNIFANCMSKLKFSNQ